MRKILLFILFAACLFSNLILTAAEYTVPKISQPPQLDGILQLGEWDEALAISGAGRKLDPRQVTAFLAFDQQFVYVALRSEMPWRGQLQVSPDTRKNVVMDDSLELWFLPPAQQRTLEAGKFGYFQLIVNSVGRLYTCHHDPGYGLPAREWKVELQQNHRCQDGFWTAEMAFPSEAFGIPQLPENGDWRILLVRNFRTEPSFQAPLTDVNGFMNTASYSLFKFRAGVNASVQAQYSAAVQRRLPAKYRILNRSAQEQKFLLQAELVNGANRKKLSRELALVSGKSGVIDLTSEIPSLETGLAVQVSDAGGEPLWQRESTWQPPPERIWFNMDSYARLEQSFNHAFPGIDFCTVEGAELSTSDPAQLASVPGRSKDKKALLLKNTALRFSGVKIPVPGSVSLWVRPESRPQKGYRRYFSSEFVSTGYLFCQEQNGMMIIGAHNFPGQGHKNLILNRVPALQEWTHIVLNLLPGRFEAWVNGIKRGELDHGVEILPEKLGDLMLGNSAERNFAAADLALYERPLSTAEIRSLAQGEAKISGNIAWYQALNAIVLDLSADLTENHNTERFQLQIRNAQEQILQRFPLSFQKGFENQQNNRILRRIHQKIPLSEPLPDGEYFFALQEGTSENVLLEKKFVVKQYSWLGNQLGLSRRLLPPFTALRRQDHTISCLLRDYTLSESGLPLQIKALNENLLASEIRLCVEAGGKLQQGRNGTLNFSEEDDLNIRYQSSMQFPGIQVRLNADFEFDGMLKLDFFFSPGSEQLPDRVWLDIPIRAEYTKLFHACGEGLRMNPGGFLPEGQGVIWKSRSIPQTNISNFIPYIWVGDDQRGICYGADWDKGWMHSDKRDAVELVRHPDGNLSIRLNLLNDPKKLLEGEPLTLALMASPVKPQPPGWRGWSDGFTSQATRITRCLYSNPYWGSYYSWTSRYPAFEDFTYIQKLVESKNTGVIDNAFIKNWTDRVMNSRVEDAPIAHRSGRAYVERHALAAFSLCKGLFPHKEIASIYPYTCNITGADSLPEFPVFQDEWKDSVHVYQSYSDYAIHYLNRMFDCGFGGVYDDNVFLAGKFHWATGNGYIDEQGNLRPSLGLWRVRNYHKRQLTLMAERGMDPWITVHHTNTNNLIALGFATNCMGMEWKYGAHDFQERFSPDYIRAVCHGKQGGFLPTILDGITGADSPEKKTWATRTMLAALLPHEVRPTCPRGSDFGLIARTLARFFQFGTHLPDCRFYAYWADENPIRLDCPQLLAASYLRSKKMLIFLGSYANEDKTDQLRFAFNGNSPGTLKRAVNLETATELPCSAGTIPVQIKKHDFLFLEVEFE